MTTHLRFDYHSLKPILIDGIPWIKEGDVARCLRVDSHKLKSLYRNNRHRFMENTTRLIEVLTPGEPRIARLYTAESANLLASFLIGKRSAAFSKCVTAAVARVRSPESVASIVVPDGAYNHTVEERLNRGLQAMAALISMLNALSSKGSALDDLTPAALSMLLDVIHTDFQAVKATLTPPR